MVLGLAFAPAALLTLFVDGPYSGLLDVAPSFLGDYLLGLLIALAHNGRVARPRVTRFKSHHNARVEKLEYTRSILAVAHKILRTI